MLEDIKDRLQLSNNCSDSMSKEVGDYLKYKWLTIFQSS